MQAAGLPDTPFDALDVAADRDALLSVLREHLQSGVELRERLRSWAEGQAENSWDNVSYVRGATRSPDS